MAWCPVNVTCVGHCEFMVYLNSAEARMEEAVLDAFLGSGEENRLRNGPKEI